VPFVKLHKVQGHCIQIRLTRAIVQKSIYHRAEKMLNWWLKTRTKLEAKRMRKQDNKEKESWEEELIEKAYH
jgi:hypothetical protein